MLWQWALFAPVLANFEVTLDSTSYSADSSVKVSWKDDGNSPKIDQFKTANFRFCAYDANSKLQCPLDLGDKVDISDSTEHTFDLSSVSNQGASGSYIFQMTGVGSKESQYVTVYASAFVQVTGLAGSGVAKAGAIPGGDISGGGADSGDMPEASDAVPSQYSNLPSPWMTPYNYQHGLTRYAPFQLTPNSSVTMPLTITRRWPTSSVSIFTEWIKTPLPVTTMTPSPSVTVSLDTNYATSFTAAYTGRKPAKVTPTNYYRQKRWA